MPVEPTPPNGGNPPGSALADVNLWTRKLESLGERVANLLAADVETWMHGLVRDAFLSMPEVDAWTDDRAAKLKQETREEAQSVAGEVRAALGPTAWAHVEPPESPETPLLQHPPVSRAVTAAERRVSRFLEDRGLVVESGPTWRLPVRFINGENLVSLTRNLWRTAERLARAREDISASESESVVDARRRRWETL